jgi:hypothetical protein
MNEAIQQQRTQGNGVLPCVTTSTFERTWKNAKLDPPKEAGRYWCVVEEQNDLGLSKYQWNCYFAEHTNRWLDDGKEYNVTYYTELAPMPF